MQHLPNPDGQQQLLMLRTGLLQNAALIDILGAGAQLAMISSVIVHEQPRVVGILAQNPYLGKGALRTGHKVLFHTDTSVPILFIV